MDSHPYPGGIEFRPALGTRGRAALEVRSDGDLLWAYVDTPFAEVVLGGLRGREDGEPWALAWGSLPPGGALPAVAFDGGAWRRRSLPARVSVVGERFWAARAEGDFRTVTAVTAESSVTWRLVNHSRS